jgi:DNA topoisomerase-1
MVPTRAESQPSEYTCPNCGRPMVYRLSRNGRYLACTGYPECKTTHPVDEKGRKVDKTFVDIACPLCSQPMVLRRGKFGPFLSCSTYPACKGVVRLDRSGCVKPPSAPPLAVELPCPKCGSHLNLRRSRRGPWLSCSKYPKCRGGAAWKTLSDDQRKRLELELLNHEKANPLPVIRKLDGAPVGPNCRPQDPAPANGEQPADKSPDEDAPASEQ